MGMQNETLQNITVESVFNYNASQLPSKLVAIVADNAEVEAVSEYLVTEPYGDVEQDEFLNGVLKLRTLLTPEELLDRLHELEAAANRERIIHWGPRTLDLDILFYDNEIIDTPDLHIPHIDMENRDFVLKPMDEIAPYYRHPVLNKTIHQLLNELLAKDNQ